jgi:uncharacterized protein YndB with AHSA1/START domain
MAMITVEVVVNRGVGKVWKDWTAAESVKKWNHASDDWECPKATNELATGGEFSYIMAAKDGSRSFDFNGVYTAVKLYKLIEYEMEGGRKVSIVFNPIDKESTKVTQTFETETEYPEEKQREGWQAIMDNFKKYCEAE